MVYVGNLQAYINFSSYSKVAARRIVAGKWGCNNGQACIAPDYIITTKSFAPKLVGNACESC